MRIIRFGPEQGRSIEQFGSTQAVITAVARAPGEGHVHWLVLAPGGLVGSHPASGDQLYLVVQGDGFVQGSAGEWLPILSGEAAFWQAGEWHASRTENGLTAVIVEASRLELNASLPGKQTAA